MGTRLGFDGPKGTFPIGPVSAASLFQIHAEKVVATGRRYGKTLPLYVMTSPDNHEATVRFFDENGRFGLDHVRFFVQGQMPAVDRETGKVLLAEKGHLALSPDGHGGTLNALAAPGPGGSPSCLDEMKELGVRTLFYFQVDNPLVKIADPAFLGLPPPGRRRDVVQGDREARARREARPGRHRRRPPAGHRVFRPPAELAERREPEGSLELWAGSIGDPPVRAVVRRAARDATSKLPFHRAVKKVPHVDAEGSRSARPSRTR